MQVYFDIQSNGDLHLDLEGMEFPSLDHAHCYLISLGSIISPLKRARERSACSGSARQWASKQTPLR